MSEELHIKKADLNASNIYQYDMLKNLKYNFIPYEYEESIDEIKILYTTEGLGSIKEFVSAKKSVKYSLIIELMDIVNENPEIYFSLSPDNIFVNSQQRIKVLRRDIKSEENHNILDEVRSLAGFLLQKKYLYDDYIEGGIRLLSKREDTKFLVECTDYDELYEKVMSLFNKEKNSEKLQNITVNKRNYLMLRTVSIGFILLTIIISIMYFRQYILVVKPSITALHAQRAYLEKDYIKVIDTLESISVGSMEQYEKYILATSYIRSQSVDAFSQETKDMLLERLSYNSDEKQLDYWIYLGRSDADSAIDIAQRLSDNQLLLYAYIQKLEILSADTELIGDEKFNQINSIRENIKSLAQTLGIKYEPENVEEK